MSTVKLPLEFGNDFCTPGLGLSNLPLGQSWPIHTLESLLLYTRASTPFREPLHPLSLYTSHLCHSTQKLASYACLHLSLQNAI